MDMLQALEEPAVDAGASVDLLDRPAAGQRRGDDEDARVGGLGQRPADVIHDRLPVGDEAVHALTDHPQPFLERLLEGAADGHDLAHALHGAAQLLVHPLELAEIPARDLAHHVVECRFEAGGGGAGDGVAELGQGVTQRQLRRHERQRVAGGLGRQRAGARQPGVDLDDPVVGGVGIEGELDVALAHDAQVADDPEGERPQLVILGVGQRLGRCDHDALAGVDAQRVEVLHVADGDAVVEPVPHHLVFHFLPTLERLLHQDLRRVGERPLGAGGQLRRVGAEAAPLPAQGEGGADDHREAQRAGRRRGVRHRGDRHAADGSHADLVEPPDEPLPVLGVGDGLDGRAEHPNAVPFQRPGRVEPQTAVERRLAAETEEDAVGPLPPDHRLDKERRDREEVDAVGHPLRRLHRGDVGVDQDGSDPFLPQRLERLGAGVVELAGLADLQRAGTQHEHGADLSVHGAPSP